MPLNEYWNALALSEWSPEYSEIMTGHWNALNQGYVPFQAAPVSCLTISISSFLNVFLVCACSLTHTHAVYLTGSS